MVVLEDSNGKREQNATGEEEVSLYLYSHLRNSLGSILDFEVLEGGANYTDNKPVTLSGNGYGLAANVSVVGGFINDVVLEESGFGYSPTDEITIETITGSGASGAVLKPIFASGTLVVEANTSIGGQQFINRVRIAPSLQETLNSKAYWMNHYLDTFYHEGNDTWWGWTWMTTVYPTLRNGKYSPTRSSKIPMGMNSKIIMKRVIKQTPRCRIPTETDWMIKMRLTLY